MAARSPALKGLGASDRDRARGCDPAKRDAPLWLRALIAVEHEMQMKCELTLHEPRELTLCSVGARALWNGTNASHAMDEHANWRRTNCEHDFYELETRVLLDAVGFEML